MITGNIYIVLHSVMSASGNGVGGRGKHAGRCAGRGGVRGGAAAVAACGGNANAPAASANP